MKDTVDIQCDVLDVVYILKLPFVFCIMDF